MGVHGLWKLIEPSGKVVPLETLEGKVLAVDISIWLHQAIKGFQDSKGAPVQNAHLLTLYHRICKLLFFRIKPVFVFDGGVPALKKETIAKRNQLKTKNLSDANKIQKQLINTLLQHTAVSKVLSEKTKATLGAQVKKTSSSKTNKTVGDDLYVLPPSQTAYESSESEYETEYDSTSGAGTTSDSSPTKYFNIHDVDPKSVQFRSLPADVRHEILTDLKETRKQNSWGRIHELPKQSDDFSLYQMKRLLKRSTIQSCLEDAEKEMGGATLSLNELESLLNDHGVITENKGNRIASDENTRYLYIKDVKKTMESARVKELNAIKEVEAQSAEGLDGKTIIDEIDVIDVNDDATVGESEFQTDLQTAIQLSLGENGPGPSTSVSNSNSCSELTETRNDDIEFQKELETAIKLSLQDAPSTSGSGSSAIATISASQECNSSNNDDSASTTPISSQEVVNTASNYSSYLQTLRDSDFESSEDDQVDDVLQQHQKTTEKIFSAARNYMIEYGGLTQAGVEDIFGHNEQIRAKTKKTWIRGKSVRYDPQVAIQHFSTDTIIIDENDKQVDAETGEKKQIVVEEVEDVVEEVAVMSDSDSGSSSDGDFVEVASDEEITKPRIETKALAPIQISFDTQEELVDDLFSDIFVESTPEVIKALPEEVTFAKPAETEIVQAADTSLEVDVDAIDLESQKQIEESIKIANEKSAPSLIQELIPQSTACSSTASTDSRPNVTVKELQQLKATLTKTSEGLMLERGTKERLAGNITDQMYQEAQDLLRLFGIPYIIAPMEAEAQCAFLNEIDLTDGTITDDSDIWLFGGRTVYKNFFNHDREVLEFRSESIQHHFKLSRHSLISLAMLVGSDYTTGIQGIGPVTALEVLAAFSPKTDFEIISTLQEFRNWFATGKKVHGRGKAYLRNKLKNVELHDGFPSSSVIKAYLEPAVETSKDEFSWGKPHLQSLIDYTKDKFGWTQKRVTDTLDPLLKRMNDNKAQKRIHDYFKTVYKAPLNTSLDIQNKLSKRVKKALVTIGRADVDIEGIASSDEDTEDMSQCKDADELAALQVLMKTKKLSKQKNKDIRQEVEKQLTIIEKKDLQRAPVDDALKVKKPRLANLHRKEVIPQKEMAKSNRFHNKMKAIEVFRKSTKGPGYIKKRGKVVRKPKDDAELSESSNSDN